MVEPGSSLGLAEVAALPLAEGDMMGTGRGGPLLEGSEAGYKRRGGGRKPVSLDAPAAFQIADFSSRAGPTFLVSKAYIFQPSMVCREHIGRCRLHGFATARGFLSISGGGAGVCVAILLPRLGGFVVQGRRQPRGPIATEDRGTKGRRRGRPCGEKGASLVSGRGASGLIVGGSVSFF